MQQVGLIAQLSELEKRKEHLDESEKRAGDQPQWKANHETQQKAFEKDQQQLWAQIQNQTKSLREQGVPVQAESGSIQKPPVTPWSDQTNDTKDAQDTNKGKGSASASSAEKDPWAPGEWDHWQGYWKQQESQNQSQKGQTWPNTATPVLPGDKGKGKGKGKGKDKGKGKAKDKCKFDKGKGKGKGFGKPPGEGGRLFPYRVFIAPGVHTPGSFCFQWTEKDMVADPGSDTASRNALSARQSSGKSSKAQTPATVTGS